MEFPLLVGMTEIKQSATFCHLLFMYIKKKNDNNKKI